MEALQNQIKQLIIEGGTQRNSLAFDIAIKQCRELIEMIGESDANLMESHVCLMAGRLEIAYDLSCYLAQKGVYLDNAETQLLRRKCIRHHNITKSYTQNGIQSGDFFVATEPEKEDWETGKVIGFGLPFATCFL